MEDTTLACFIRTHGGNDAVVVDEFSILVPGTTGNTYTAAPTLYGVRAASAGRYYDHGYRLLTKALKRARQLSSDPRLARQCLRQEATLSPPDFVATWAAATLATRAQLSTVVVSRSVPEDGWSPIDADPDDVTR